MKKNLILAAVLLIALSALIVLGARTNEDFMFIVIPAVAVLGFAGFAGRHVLLRRH